LNWRDKWQNLREVYLALLAVKTVISTSYVSLVNRLICGDFSDNVANQETDELVTAERHEAETFGEDGSRSISQEHLDVAPTSFVEPEMDNTLQVVNLLVTA